MDLWVVLCNFLGIPLFLCLSANIIPTKFLYEHYKHRWTLPTCIGVWTLTYFVNAQIVLYRKIATYIPKGHGNTMESLQTSTHCPSTNHWQQSISYWQNNILNVAILLLYRLFCIRCPNFRILLSHFDRKMQLSTFAWLPPVTPLWALYGTNMVVTKNFTICTFYHTAQIQKLHVR